MDTAGRGDSSKDDEELITDEGSIESAGPGAASTGAPTVGLASSSGLSSTSMIHNFWPTLAISPS